MTHPLQIAIRTLAIGVLAATVAPGQNVLNDTKKIADARKLFDTLGDDQSGCEVSQLKLRLIFSLRLQAGYVARLPLAQSQGQGQKWVVLIRITPQEGNGDPVYLSDVAQFPEGGVIGQESKIEGSYWLGEGRYAVKFLMFDSRGDVCRKDWQIDARQNSGVSKFKPILAPGTVGGSLGTGGVRTAGAKPIDRLTILLHAASVLQRQTLLGPLDKTMLLDGIVALMQELPRLDRCSWWCSIWSNGERCFGRRVSHLRRCPKWRKSWMRSSLRRWVTAPFRTPVAPRALSRTYSTRKCTNPSRPRQWFFWGPSRFTRVGRLPNSVFRRGTEQRFYYLMCEPTRFLLPRSSTLDGGDWRAQGLAMGFPPRSPSGAIQPNAPDVQPNVPNDLVWKNYGPNAGADSIEYTLGQLKGKTVQVDSAGSFASAVAEIIRLPGKNR